jgi:hypothetical protein
VNGASDVSFTRSQNFPAWPPQHGLRALTLASDIPPVVEMLEDGRTGLVYPLGDTDALTRAVERLLENPALAGDIARNAADRVNGLTARTSARRLAVLVREVALRAGNNRAPTPVLARPPSSFVPGSEPPISASDRSLP